MAYASLCVNPLFIPSSSTRSSPSFCTTTTTTTTTTNNNNNTKQVLFNGNGKSNSSLLLGSTSGFSFTMKRMATPIPNSAAVKAEAAAVTIEKAGIKIVRNPPESQLSQLGVRKWPKWGCPPSKFPWTYSAKETCYLLEGKVKVYPDGSDEAVEIGAGDLVVFPKGMSCTWEVSVGVDKHYNFE